MSGKISSERWNELKIIAVQLVDKNKGWDKLVKKLAEMGGKISRLELVLVAMNVGYIVALREAKEAR